MSFDRVVAIIGLIFAIIPFIPFRQISIPPLWLVVKVCLVYLIATLSTLLLVFFVKKKYTGRFFGALRLALFLLLPVGTLVALNLVISHGILPTRESQKVEASMFPQAYQFGPSLIRTYATNGKCTFRFNDKKEPKGPDGFVKIELQCFGKTVSENCGWVYFLTKGVDISKYTELRFFIRGGARS